MKEFPLTPKTSVKLSSRLSDSSKSQAHLVSPCAQNQPPGFMLLLLVILAFGHSGPVKTITKDKPGHGRWNHHPKQAWSWQGEIHKEMAEGTLISKPHPFGTRGYKRWVVKKDPNSVDAGYSKHGAVRLDICLEKQSATAKTVKTNKICATVHCKNGDLHCAQEQPNPPSFWSFLAGTFTTKLVPPWVLLQEKKESFVLSKTNKIDGTQGTQRFNFWQSPRNLPMASIDPLWTHNFEQNKQMHENFGRKFAKIFRKYWSKYLK